MESFRRRIGLAFGTNALQGIPGDSLRPRDGDQALADGRAGDGGFDRVDHGENDAVLEPDLPDTKGTLFAQAEGKLPTSDRE